MEESIVRQAVRQALTHHRVAADEDSEEIGDLQIAEYVVFLLALDTYMRYVEEATGTDPQDEVTHKGIRILRISDAMIGESLERVMAESLPSESHKKLLQRAMIIRAINPQNAGRRALLLRTVLSRGGAATQRAVFQTNRALKEIREAMSASMVDDADVALDKFAAISMRNLRLKNWIDLAAKTAVQREIPKNAVEAGSKEAVDQASVLLNQQVQSAGSRGAEGVDDAQKVQVDILNKVELEATSAAKKAIDTSGESDASPTRAETVGIAVAVAAAALGDPSKAQNVPDPLRRLDDEQRAAALSDGRVLVAAGAGSGKSTTLIARVSYLVKERRVIPSRILVTSFNKGAADELRDRIRDSIGKEALDQMTAGTMHSLFKAKIGEYGTPQERGSMGLGGNSSLFVGGGGKVASRVQKLWAECFDKEEKPVPKLKVMMLAKSKWAGNSISPAEATAEASSQGEQDAALWYTIYEGLKGAIPGWKPPCEGKSLAASESEYQDKLRQWKSRGGYGSPPQRRKTTFEAFMATLRPNGARLGDFDDMLSIFNDILKREPAVRKTLQNQYDHILVDECQDLNAVQNSIFEMMSEHISTDSEGKSVWMVGDDSQSIYSFRGARPDIFIKRHTATNWKTRTIRTNYRCAPEIVDHANALIGHNTNRIPMEALPCPSKPRGEGSIRVVDPFSEAEAALDVASEIKGGLASGASNKDYAILTRTNAELNSYETALIIRGIPYARKGAASFLGSPETQTFLSYGQLVTGDDFERMQEALKAIINKPNRFWVFDDKKSAQAVTDALSAYARNQGQTVKMVNPIVALGDPNFQNVLAEKLAGVGRGFKFDKTVEKIEELQRAVQEMQANITLPGFKTTDLFDSILGLSGTVGVTDPATGRSSFVEQTLREQLQVQSRDSLSDEEDTEEDEDEQKGLGNIAFLYQLAKPDPTDPEDAITTPELPLGFMAKMDRYANRAKDLRQDPDKVKPGEELDAVRLSTIHKVKGAQWKNVYVQMPAKKFPMEPRVKPGEEPPPEEETLAERETERRLAYVALTRAISHLTVICPDQVGGKQAGVSVFVKESDLKLGENVPKPVADPPIDLSPEVQGEDKTASEDDYLVPYEWVN